MNLVTWAMALLLAAPLAGQKIYYVKVGSTGNGDSWERALGDLTLALAKARSGDEIWVAAGTYTPTRNDDRQAAFVIPDGVGVYGGFAGTETNRFQRDWQLNKTFLSGEIGSPNLGDNCYNVVITRGVSSATVVDGFIITGGSAGGSTPAGDRFRCGGGWYNDGTQQPSNPIISNCTFLSNYARDGGALYNNGAGGEASPVLLNCRFFANRADMDGGALFNDGRKDGKSNPRLENCRFEGNQANYGGAVLDYGAGGQASPRFFSCQFINNQAYMRGGGLFNLSVDGEALPDLQHCRFLDNYPDNKSTYRPQQYEDIISTSKL